MENQSVTWTEAGRRRSARWRSEGRASPPARVIVADDALRADTAYRNACEGTAMLWRGDFQNARQLLAAMARRVERKGREPRRPDEAPASPAEAFHHHRRDAARRAHILGMLLVELEADHSIRLGRAPDVARAVSEAHGPSDSSSVMPLRDLLGIIGAHEWRRKGVEVRALGARIHPHYGVFPPIRQEYVELVAATPLPTGALAFDIGTGTGVLAALLARRGVARVVATDDEPRAVACATANITRLGLDGRIEVVEADLYPPPGYPQAAPLIVFNPPWIPAKATTSLERAVYDPKGRTLQRFLNGLPAHLTSPGEAWLLLSDLAEQLGLRTRDELLAAFDDAGLVVIGRSDARPVHPRATDESDPLHSFRQAETISLWRLTPR
jgi:SAM-dependent methyltransferase